MVGSASMIWRFLQSSPVQVPVREDCPNDVWAARDRQGAVPKGWVGLRVASDGHCLDWVQEGDVLKPTNKRRSPGAVWWVRALSWTFCFAPCPVQAPEAGLKVTLKLDCSNPHGRTLLASALSLMDDDVTDLSFATEWSSLNVIITALQPCIQQLELEHCAQKLEALVWPVWCARVQCLERVDLSLLPEQNRGQEMPEAPSDQTKRRNDGALKQGATSGVRNKAPLTEEQIHPSLHQLQCKDRQTWTLVARELPRLGVTLERCWAGGGWSTESAVIHRQRAVAQRLGLMAGKLGALPALNIPRDSSALSLVAQYRLAWAHSADVLEALTSTQFALAALPQDRVPPDEYRLKALEQAVLALDERVHERLHPWWE